MLFARFKDELIKTGFHLTRCLILRPEIASTDHVQHPGLPHVHISVWQQVLRLERDGGHCMGDYDIDGLVDIVTKIAKLGLRSLKIKRIHGV